MRMEPESGCSRPISNRSSTLFPVPLLPSTARISPFATVRSIPFSTCCEPNDLESALTTTGSIKCLRKQHKDQPHQHHIGQNNEQRREHHRTGSRPSHALGPAACAHSLKAGN